MKTKSILIPLAVAALCAAETFAAPMGTAFTYQGRLNAGGQPATGSYDFAFGLFDSDMNGAALGNMVYLSAIPVTNGLFTVQVNSNNEFGGSAFNGSARWLEIWTRTNGNYPGNNFVLLSPRQPLTPAPSALFASNAVQAITANSANSAATAQTANVANSVAWANITGIPAGFADGVDNGATYTAGAGLNLNWVNQFSVDFGGSGSAPTAAHSDHGHFGAAWGGNASLGTGLSVTNGAANGAGLYGQQGTGSGFPYIFGNNAGVWGESSQGSGVHGASATGAGVRGLTLGTNGFGLYGSALRTNGTSYGVHGASSSATGIGVYGLGGKAATNSDRGYIGSAGFGVVGESAAGMGVMGISDTFVGVYGSSVNSVGVHGDSPNGVAVSGATQAGTALSAYSISGTGLEVQTQSGNLIDCYQLFNGRKFRVSAAGEVYAAGAFHPNGADFAEMLPAQNALEPGDVLVIGEDGKLARSTQPYQENVAGVHATKPGMLGGAHEGADLTGKSPLAVVGVVPVKVTDENGSIKPGDKLTSSSTTGHAMKADKHAGIGTVIGKALSALKGDRGVIEMLVILQ